MSEVTYFDALPFVATDDGIAPASPLNASILQRSRCVRRRCHGRKVMLRGRVFENSEVCELHDRRRDLFVRITRSPMIGLTV